MNIFKKVFSPSNSNGNGNGNSYFRHQRKRINSNKLASKLNLFFYRKGSAQELKNSNYQGHQDQTTDTAITMLEEREETSEVFEIEQDQGPLLSKADLLVYPSFLSPMLFSVVSTRDSESTLTEISSKEERVKVLRSPTSAPSVELGESKVTLPCAQYGLSLQTLPVELFLMIAMSSGFRAAMKLRATNRKFRHILSQSNSWSGFSEWSPDVIHTKVVIETKLHQWDQIVFAQWPSLERAGPSKSIPCIIHRTFLEQYDFLGGLSLKMNPSGMAYCDFFEHRESLPCYIADIQSRMASGTLPQVLTTDESPVGGVRVNHTCSECKHYDEQEVIKSELVHQIMAEGEDISHVYHIDSKHEVTVVVTTINSVFGYNNEIPCVSTKIWKIDGVELDKGLHNFYLKYVC